MRRTGRKPCDPSLVVPHLADFRRGTVAPPPASMDFYSGVAWQMFGNDVLADCTIAGIANGILQRTTLALGTPLVMPDATVRDVYFGLTGGSDDGLVETDVLTWFARTGIDLGRQAPEVALWARVDHTDPVALKRAIADFGSVYVGWDLPPDALTANEWTGTAQTGVDGHCTLIAGYDADRWYCPSWGEVIAATDGFRVAYMREAYALVSIDEWIAPGGMSPASLDYDGLREALASLG